jgi:hypothetical protein
MSFQGPNPYAPPNAPIPHGSMLPPCPQCRGYNVHQPAFTWWGGVLGPKLFKHTVCRQCGFGYNARTGKSNNTAIALYVGGGVVLAILVFIGMIAARM